MNRLQVIKQKGFLPLYGFITAGHRVGRLV